MSSKRYPKVSVIIVNYNTRDLLTKCIDNLEGTYPNLEIIVVDNNSTDGSAEKIKKDYKFVKLIESENKGLAYGSNLGYKASKGEYLLYLGSDAYPQKDVIKGMIDYMESNGKVGISTAKLITRSGQIDLDAHRGFPTPWTAITHFTRLNKLFPKSKIFNKYFIGWENLEMPHEIDLCISHFMLIRRSVFKKIGLWDENYFLFGEDVDFCYRTKINGFKIMYLPQFEVLHYKGASVGTRKETADITKATKDTVVKMNKETTKAMKLFYKKHYSEKYPKIVTASVLFGIDLMSKFRSLKKVR